ncbi:conserved hypothetical protein [uncultured Paludibacter sp.]|uniref:Winged helix DNA-binding domain-containing protein n=1 Tax=uncultured Paludibacter sp. TaxID=497635 RepID=A0A653ACT4_9BACT|nr:conserved hypothetical protein [uncultured Paludibacter sp.]
MNFYVSCSPLWIEIMNYSDISIQRLKNQQIVQSCFSSSKQLVEWMGAIQAQDLPMALLAIALRTKNSSVKSIEKTFNDGEIIRTHLMRPTWHIVSKDDIYWMLDLTAHSIKRMIGGRHNQLELSKEILSKANRLLEKNLQGSELTREKIAKIFSENNIRTDENRLSHFLMNAELEQLICSNSLKGRWQTYALLEEKVPDKKRLSREESILKLTERFFFSHAPATIADFAWWSFLPVKDIRWALEDLKSKFDSEKIEEETYYFPPETKENKTQKSSIHLLPAYDEFLISYKTKHISIANLHQRKAASVNGIFFPIIVENGQIIGTWKKVTSKKNMEIETTFFNENEIDLNNETQELLKLFI